MALVGPRPALWNQYDLLVEREQYGANSVRPGLTGWAQIHGRDELPIRQKAELDGYYVHHQELIDRIASQSPDLILLTGDLLNSGEPVTEIATNLISSLCEIAPVYLSLGNHEIEYQDNFGTDITQLYQDAGAIVLEHQYRDITVKGQSLRIGGIYGYCLPDKYLETEEADLSECMFLWDFENTDRYKILLSHLPIAWLKNDALEEWNVDCVFSGHLHGGQVILPGIGGVYAPDMGWFPGRLKGVFDSEDGKRHLVLSAGLGNTEVIPRFNNIPEIVCVDLVPEGGW